MDLTAVGRGDDVTSQFTRKVAVDFGDDNVLNVTVRPLGLSAKTQTLIARAQAFTEDTEIEPEEAQELLLLSARVLSEVVADWDLTSGRKKLKPTFEELSNLPLDVLNTLLTKIMEAVADLGKATSAS